MFLSFASLLNISSFSPLAHSFLPFLLRSYPSGEGVLRVSGAIDFFPSSFSLSRSPSIFLRGEGGGDCSPSTSTLHWIIYLSVSLPRAHERARRRRRLPIHPTHNRTRQTDDGENKLTRLVSEHTINIDFFVLLSPSVRRRPVL